MTPAMIAALQQQRASATGFFELDLPSGTRRLMIGSGEASSGGNTFKGYDATIGAIVSGDAVREDASGEAPNTSLTISVASGADRADIASEVVQLAPVKISLAALTFDGSNHQIAIPDPELLFDGFVDQATIGLDQKKDEITYSIISAFDYFFEDSEGQRLNGEFHQSVWPGETGLDNVNGVTRKVYWGTYGPGAANGGGSSPLPDYCVACDSMILLADGSECRADQALGERVWTRHEVTGDVGAFVVTAVEIVETEVMAADGWPSATPDHRFALPYSPGPIEWFRMRKIGTPDGVVPVARITVEDAHTYMARHPSPGSPWRLSHNVKIAVY